MKLRFKIAIPLAVIILTTGGYYLWCQKKLATGKSSKESETATQAAIKQMEMMGHISVSPNQRLMANIATVKAELTPFNKEINAVGIVRFDQARQARVTSWVAGRIDRLYVNKVGDFVTKDRPVAPGMPMGERKGKVPAAPSPKKGGGMDMKDMKM